MNRLRLKGLVLTLDCPGGTLSRNKSGALVDGILGKFEKFFENPCNGTRKRHKALNRAINDTLK
jgi:hypothetical protein